MILNAKSEFHSLPHYVLDAFSGRTASKVLLRPGFKLYKLSDFKSLTMRDGVSISPWLSPYDSYEYDAGWEARVHFAKHLQANLRELSRVVVAVKEEWNSFDWMVVFRLTEPVYAFFGGVAPQDRLGANETSKRNPQKENRVATKRLVGSASQFYLPGLTKHHVAESEVRAVP